MHTSEDPSLTGRRILLTGASGGIGSATARLLSRSACRLALHYRTGRQRAEELAAELAAERDGSPDARRATAADSKAPEVLEVTLGADLRSEHEVEALFGQAIGSLGGLDSLVANAGAWPKEATPIAAMDLERWQETLAANLTATFLACRGFLRAIRASQAGDRTGTSETETNRVPSIVVVGSTAGLFGEEGHADYAAAKSALHGLVRSLKNEIVRIHPEARVNLVAPGWVATPMAREAMADEQRVAKVTSTIATGRVARPQDVAHAVRFLLSHETARHISGTILPVHGGMEGRLLHPERLAANLASEPPQGGSL